MKQTNFKGIKCKNYAILKQIFPYLVDVLIEIFVSNLKLKEFRMYKKLCRDVLEL